MTVSPHQPHFSPKQIAKALGSSESSVKRWCDQGAVPTIRTVGGHRRITLEGLASFLQDSGRTLLAPEVLGIPNEQNQRDTTLPDGATDHQTEFRVSLSRGDESGCRGALRRLVKRGMSRSEAANLLITDAMHGIGQGWSDHTIETYEERRAVTIASRLINELRAEVGPHSPHAPIAIGGTPQGDPYQLPTALVELTLRESGWRAINLGANLPWPTLRQAVIDYRPRVLWLSVSGIDDVETFVEEQNALHREFASDVALFVGGRALNDEIRPRLSFTAHCDHLGHLVELSSLLLLR